MHALTYSRPAAPAIRALLGRSATDHFVLANSTTALADHAEATVPHSRRAHMADDRKWFGGHTFADALKATRQGEASMVAASDGYLKALEDQVHPRRSFAVKDDVVGGLPNVPAYLAGHPLSMRRRVRVEAERAPLSILVDVTPSMSITADQLAKRGAAILALVRVLSAVRPVTLHAVAAVDADLSQNAVHIITRIDTAPLDLARAAYILGHASYVRGLTFGIAEEGYGFDGRWPYGLKGAHRPHGHAIYAGVIPGASELLYVPAVHAKDRSITDALAWVKEMVAAHGNEEIE